MTAKQEAEEKKRHEEQERKKASEMAQFKSGESDEQLMEVEGTGTFTMGKKGVDDAVKKEEAKEPEEDTGGPKPMLPYTSMFILSSTNPIREFCHYVVNLPYFDAFIMVVIGLSSMALAAEDPVDESSATNEMLNTIDYAFTFIFTIEMLLKVIDQGIIMHPGSYCRDVWNIMDATVVICAWTGFIM